MLLKNMKEDANEGTQVLHSINNLCLSIAKSKEETLLYNIFFFKVSKVYIMFSRNVTLSLQLYIRCAFNGYSIILIVRY